MFDKINLQQQEGTPRKIRKLNNFSTFDEEFEAPGELTKKKSFMESLQFIGAISRKDSFQIKDARLRKNSVSHFSIADWDDLVNLAEVKEDSGMDIEAPL